MPTTVDDTGPGCTGIVLTTELVVVSMTETEFPRWLFIYIYLSKTVAEMGHLPTEMTDQTVFLRAIDFVSMTETLSASWCRI